MLDEPWTNEQLYYLFLNYWRDHREADSAALRRAEAALHEEEDDESHSRTPAKPRVRMSLEVFSQSLGHFQAQRSEFLAAWKKGYFATSRAMAAELEAVCTQAAPIDPEVRLDRILAIIKRYNHYIYLS